MSTLVEHHLRVQPGLNPVKNTRTCVLKLVNTSIFSQNLFFVCVDQSYRYYPNLYTISSINIIGKILSDEIVYQSCERL